MIVGQDFEKIHFDAFGFHLLEPNAFAGDTLIAAISWYFTYRIHKMNRSSHFFTFWKYALFVFGLSFFTGGFGHLLFGYWGVPGRYVSWYLGLLAPYFIERAMYAIYPDASLKRTFEVFSLLKLIIAIIGVTFVNLYVDLESDISKGMHVLTANSVLGLSFALGYLGWQYTKMYTADFKYAYWSVLIMLPAVPFQVFKINFAPWFDRNDVGHLLLVAGLIFYYRCVSAYNKHLRPFSALS